jgi:hypothetical protein
MPASQGHRQTTYAATGEQYFSFHGGIVAQGR